MTEPVAQHGTHAVGRPKNAATLIVHRRKAGALQFLMGRRAAGVAFFPGALVFPGGRVDLADHFAPAADELHPDVVQKLIMGSPQTSAARARALAMAAIRETYEETGYLIGVKTGRGFASRSAAWSGFLDKGVVPVLSDLRLLARAITPPGWVRRFDTRFFVVDESAIVDKVAAPDDELEEPSWVTPEEARAQNLPEITDAVIAELERRMAEDGGLRADGPVWCARSKNGRPVVSYV